MHSFIFQIDIDYNALFPNSTTIYKEFNDKYEKLFSILDEKIKDAGCRKIFEEIKSSSNVNESKIVVQFFS